MAKRGFSLLFFSLVLSLAACSRGDSSEKSAPPEETRSGETPNPAPTPLPETGAQLLQNLNGSWVSACEDVTAAGDAQIKGKQLSFKVAGDRVTETLLFYDSATCTELIGKMDYFSKVSAITNSSELTFNFNLELIDYLITPLSEGLAADYNTRAVCGLSSGWFVFEPRGVTSLECEPLKGSNIIGRLWGSIHYDILKTDHVAAPTTLQFGQPLPGSGSGSGSGSSPETRPTEFSAVVFHRP